MNSVFDVTEFPDHLAKVLDALCERDADATGGQVLGHDGPDTRTLRAPPRDACDPRHRLFE